MGLHRWAQAQPWMQSCKCQCVRLLPFFLNTILFLHAPVCHASSPCSSPPTTLKKEKEKALYFQEGEGKPMPLDRVHNNFHTLWNMQCLRAHSHWVPELFKASVITDMDDAYEPQKG